MEALVGLVSIRNFAGSSRGSELETLQQLASHLRALGKNIDVFELTIDEFGEERSPARHAILALALGTDPLVPHGPIAPVDFIVAGSFFLLREVELAAAQYSHITMAPDFSSVTWLLPTSKTDPRAVGISRSWDCTCSIADFSGACPVHSLARQLDRASAAASRLSLPLSSLPLFHTVGGTEPSKQAVVSTIFRLAELTGEPVRNSTGG